jgi:SAM-dependent methyltransferase
LSTQVFLRNGLAKDEAGVWVPGSGRQAFGYSDGRWVERYLERVFRSAKDLSSNSEELEYHIKDWNTEYHLTRKRKDLLAGLTHRRDANVLEIGSGCGAITRFLGEQYHSVTAVEGSYERAKLARLRTIDLANVEVVASNYQDIGLEGQFDIVFCIGVLEYAPTYVSAADPFAHALESMRRMLKPGGTLVLAIENKLGLKYFANSREDHSGTFFEGIEGYPRMASYFETFGRSEIIKLLETHWQNIEFYYPFPDYKIPSALLCDKGLKEADFGEMLASLHERDYAGNKPPFFDSRLAWPGIAKNGLVGEFSNSFLIVAGAGSELAPSMGDSLAVLFNRERRAKFATRSVVEKAGKAVTVIKTLDAPVADDSGSVSVVPTQSTWLDRQTVAYTLFRNAHAPKMPFEVQTAPIKQWWSAILEAGEMTETGLVVPGDMIDAVWHNACMDDDGSVQFFDQEFIWKSAIPANELFLRAAFQWVLRYLKDDMPQLSAARAITPVKRLAEALDITITSKAISNFVAREATLQSEIGFRPKQALARSINARLYVPHLGKLEAGFAWVNLQLRRIRNFVLRFMGK